MPTFQAEPMVALGGQAISIALGDFNGDGRADVAVGRPTGETVEIWLRGPSGFSIAGSYAGAGDTDLAVADLDNDGDLDLASVSYDDETMSTLLNDGSGVFTATSYPADSSHGIAVGLLDFDALPDVVVAPDAGNIVVRLGVGGGAFGAGTLVLTGNPPNELALADFNSDGELDVVIAGSSRVSLLIGHGDGNFGAPVDLGGGSAHGVAAGDFNGDGHMDIAYSRIIEDGVRVRLGDGTGGFAASVFYATGDGPRDLIAQDMTGDAVLDLVVANFDGDTVTLLQGAGDGTFEGSSFAAGDGPLKVAVGDVNGDGWQDIAASNYGGNSFTVLLATATLSIAADAPAVRAEGQSGTTAYTFTVTREGPTNQAASAAWTVTGFGGDAAVAADFQGGVLPSGTVNFGVGQTTATITVNVAADTTIEPDEGFQVTLSSPTNAAIQTATATAGIQNDDSAPPPRPPPRVVPTVGGSGNDLAVLDDKPTTYAAGDGDDLVAGEGGADTVHGNVGQDTLYGGLGDDIVRGGQGGDALYGDDGADLLFGDKGDDLVHGGRGDDIIEGGEGSDALTGGQGNDVLSGGLGDDMLSGDRGDDLLFGGLGADVFRIFSGGGADVVVDFNAAEGDRVQVLGTYTLRQAGSDVVVDLSDGATLTLQQVQLASLPAGWIFT